jgi:predicted small lipoprotein YifL
MNESNPIRRMPRAGVPALLLVLAGCGAKGELVLPEDGAAAQPEATAPADAANPSRAHAER